MKYFNRTTRRYETKEEFEASEAIRLKSLKKREQCRGGKAHDFILSLPYPYERLSVTPEAVEEYYRHEERVARFFEEETEILKGFGIDRRLSFFEKNVRKHYICSRCGKKDVIYEKN